jgi:hypothetical protein
MYAVSNDAHHRGYGTPEEIIRFGWSARPRI